MFDGLAGPGRRLAIGSFRLDVEGQRLLDGAGRNVPLRQKSFDVLRVLAERAGMVVTRDELLDLVWGDVHVTDDSVTQCVVELRRALGALGSNVIRTVPRRGYALNDPADATCGEQSRATVAIVPFIGLGGATAALVGAALTEDLALAFVRLGRVTVARQPLQPSVVAAPGGALRHASSVDHGLRGSVRVGPTGLVRITAELIEAGQGAVLWADRFDQRATEAVLVDALDELVATIASAVCDVVQERVHRGGVSIETCPVSKAQRSDAPRPAVPSRDKPAHAR